MLSSKKFTGRYLGALAGAVLAFILWITPHEPYSFSTALAISLLPLVLGFLGNYVQWKLYPEQKG